MPIPASEQRLVDLVTETAGKVARGDARLREIAGEIERHQSAAALEAEELGRQQAAAALEGSPAPDAKSARARIDKHRKAATELGIEQAEITQQIAELTAMIEPRRQELQRIRRRRAGEAGASYHEAVLADAVSLLPRIAASLAIKNGEQISFFSSPERVTRALIKAVPDRREFVASCAREYADLLTSLKLSDPK